MTEQHTPTPWKWHPEESQQRDYGRITTESGSYIATVCDTKDADRIVACVNKLAAFTTKEIEAGIDICALKQQLDEAQMLIKLLHAWHWKPANAKPASEITDHPLWPPNCGSNISRVKPLWDRVEQLVQKWGKECTSPTI